MYTFHQWFIESWICDFVFLNRGNKLCMCILIWSKNEKKNSPTGGHCTLFMSDTFVQYLHVPNNGSYVSFKLMLRSVLCLLIGITACHTYVSLTYSFCSAILVGISTTELCRPVSFDTKTIMVNNLMNMQCTPIESQTWNFHAATEQYHIIGWVSTCAI